jgi:light-regulated signal transduction histidine kinase (bacteriophytochrome)
MHKAETYTQPDLPDVYRYRHGLIEVMQNLIDNASKYMGGQTAPHIEIGLTGQENDHLFFVKDNGMGIAPDHCELIFG